MEVLRHNSLHTHVLNLVTADPLQPGSPDPGKSKDEPLLMGGDDREGHKMPPCLQPTFFEGGLDED